MAIFLFIKNFLHFEFPKKKLAKYILRLVYGNTDIKKSRK